MITKQQFEFCPFERIIFDHRPKCAGTTIDQIFHRLFNYSRLDTCGNVDFDAKGNRLECTYINDWSEDIFYKSAHHWFSPKVFNPQDGDFYFTFVRHPVELFFSNYYFINFKIKNSIQQSIDSQWDKKTQEIFSLSVYDFVKYMLKIGKNAISLTKHFHHLNKYTFVGVVEKMYGSIQAMSNILNIDILMFVDIPMLNICPIQKTMIMVDELTDMFKDEIDIWKTYYELI